MHTSSSMYGILDNPGDALHAYGAVYRFFIIERNCYPYREEEALYHQSESRWWGDTVQ